MAEARAVLVACLDEAILATRVRGRVSIDGETYVPAERLHSLLTLAREALDAADRDIPDERIRQSGLDAALKAP